uniref:Reverse transcriptase zinc-binding domain-containing protein n=1 Tax=Setaria viridis TaxID=4556 RepID=A0A4U6SZ08_SETVI|nr:hypothetical protein SEVIR_9G294100v2 [Setaria viridis]
MILDSYSCVLCSQDTTETTPHLFLWCPFSKECWNRINLHISKTLSGYDIFVSLKHQISQPFFMGIIILMTWSIWTSRNLYLQTFKKEFALLLHRGKKNFFPGIELWLDNML